MAMGQFNSVSLFAITANPDPDDGSVDEAVFGISGSQNRELDNTMSIYTSENGSSGAKVSVHRSLLLSALTMNSRTHATIAWQQRANGSQNNAENNDFNFSLASEKVEDTITLDSISVNVFLTALENIAALRAQNGASMSRLNFQAVNLSRQRTNMEAANGRIIDVDIAAESTRFTKYNVLTQSAAAMLAQANSAPDVALILLRG